VNGYRAKVERAMHTYDVFNFAYKAVVEGLKLDPTSEEAMRIWHLVEQVAAGEITLNISPAEHAVAHPPLTEAMQKGYEENFQRNKRAEQEIARELVKARDSFSS
jgi:hypothetical protein